MLNDLVAVLVVSQSPTSAKVLRSTRIVTIRQVVRGGLKVAVLAIVPIVLLTPPAIVGIQTLFGHPPAPHDGTPGRLIAIAQPARTPSHLLPTMGVAFAVIRCRARW